jgi:hypothetical protein
VKTVKIFSPAIYPTFNVHLQCSLSWLDLDWNLNTHILLWIPRQRTQFQSIPCKRPLTTTSTNLWQSLTLPGTTTCPWRSNWLHSTRSVRVSRPFYYRWTRCGCPDCLPKFRRTLHLLGFAIWTRTTTFVIPAVPAILSTADVWGSSFI